MVKPTYEANASITLIPPKVAVTVGDNPYLYLGGLEQALGVLQVKVGSPEVSAPLLARYRGAQLTVAPDASTTGPIMTVTVTTDSADSAMELLHGAVALVPQTLQQLQVEQKVPAASMISTLELSADAQPTKVAKKQVQMTVMAAVGGLAATLLLTGLLDRLMSRKRGRRQVPSPDAAQATPFGPVRLEPAPSLALDSQDRRARSSAVDVGT
ncbi:hypothetical protein [Specibacter cremeus]|uniref:hypothetical protein n=1 Tax=Specibacter cremeus TaxID=1629051 RepID=UPI000F7AD134|nr:hypothetical protein [Specibacter cremeus]